MSDHQRNVFSGISSGLAQSQSRPIPGASGRGKHETTMAFSVSLKLVLLLNCQLVRFQAPVWGHNDIKPSTPKIRAQPSKQEPPPFFLPPSPQETFPYLRDMESTTHRTHSRSLSTSFMAERLQQQGNSSSIPPRYQIPPPLANSQPVLGRQGRAQQVSTPSDVQLSSSPTIMSVLQTASVPNDSRFGSVNSSSRNPNSSIPSFSHNASFVRNKPNSKDDSNQDEISDDDTEDLQVWISWWMVSVSQ
jgi:hypothetical protein